jgi:SOS response regulatory protein OraA/RecX
MPRVTALVSAGRGRVRVELDGEAWRTLPAEAVLRAGLAAGAELDRPRLRTLGRELRRARALGVATRAVAHRDLSEHALRERLHRAGVPSAGQEEALETLQRAGLVDDARFARSRANALAHRDRGDAAIRFDLEGQGIAGEQIDAAVAELEPERTRAERVVARRGRGSATARFLAARGFEEDVVEAALTASVAHKP